ncbi:MAG: hypothetical protein ABI175_27020 [Polyangiales bacterium]
MKCWTEPFDPTRHVDHFRNGGAGIRERDQGALQYFVRVAGFTFELATLGQLRECIEWFSIKIHPSSREQVFEPEKGEWQPWHSRLPASVKKASKRERVLEALRAALVELDR